MKNINSISSKLLIPLLVLLAFCIVTSSIIENHLGVMIISGLWLVFGLILIRVSFSKNNRKQSVLLFFLFFTLYYLYMFLTNLMYVRDPHVDFFNHLDSLEFYTTIDSILKQSDSLSMYNRVLFDGRNWPGFATISWITGVISYSLGETNNIVMQKTQIVFVCAMSIIFLYNIARLFFPEVRSRNIALTFGLLGHILVFSATYSRDVHILLLYTIGFFIFLKPWGFKNIFLLAIVGIITAQFRLQHGIFFIIIIAGYIYLWTNGIKNKLISYLLMFVCLIGLAGFILANIDSYRDETLGKLENYQEYHEKQFEESSGFTSIVSRLPSFLQPVGNAFIAQTYPYPPHRVVYVSVIREYQYLLFPLGFSQVFWITVWCILLTGILSRQTRKKLPFNLKLALVISLLLILATASGSYEYRRMLGAYPIIFVVASFFYYNFERTKRRILVNRIIIFQIIAFGFYIAVKGF